MHAISTTRRAWCHKNDSNCENDNMEAQIIVPIIGTLFQQISDSRR